MSSALVTYTGGHGRDVWNATFLRFLPGSRTNVAS